MNVELTEQDRADALRHKLMPAKDVVVGGRYLYRAKVGGESALITVQVKGLFTKPHNLGGTVKMAYVFGFGFHGAVNQKKMLENRKKRN